MDREGYRRLPDRRGGTIGIPRRDDPGDILREYDVPYIRTSGLAWDSEHGWMWGLNHNEPRVLYALDPENGEVVREFDVQGRCTGLFYLNGVLYVGGWSDNARTIFRYDTDGNALEALRSPLDLESVFIGSDGEFLYTNRDRSGEVRVFTLDNLEQAGVIDYSDAVGGARILNLEIVTAHPDGSLWLCSEGHLYECNVDEDWNCELVQEFAFPLQGTRYGIAHDGENMWVGIYGGAPRWHVIDDGVQEESWLSYDPAGGEIDAGDRLDASAPDFYVLSPIIDQVILAKDQDGNFMTPEFRFSNLPPWRETRGYQIKVDADVVLNYPPAQEAAASMNLAAKARGAGKSHYVHPGITGRNMSVLIADLRLQIEDFRPSELGVFTTGGRCVGATAISNRPSAIDSPPIGLAVWGDDPSTDEIDGAFEGESLTFKLWDGTGEYELLLEWLSGDPVYSTDAFAAARATFNPHPSSFILSEPYPNPFNSTTKISYSLVSESTVKMQVFDLTGQLVITLVNDRKYPGVHSVIWNGISSSGVPMPSGLYFCRIIARDANLETQKRARMMLLLK